ncbi:MAG: IS110 family transposase [Aminipila sp.]
MIAVGIDVSKSKSTIAIINSDGEILLKPKNFNHTISGLNALTDLIQVYMPDVKVAMEATGHYHYPILKTLLNENIHVSLINPYLMKKYGDNSIRKGKTDKKDALKIAIYVIEKAYQLQPYTNASQKYDDLKFLSRQYQQCISMKIKSRVQLTNLLDEVMPGIKSLLSPNPNLSQSFFYDFVEKYENFENIKKMGERRFINSYTKFAAKKRCRNVQTKALAIYELAKNSITTRGTDISTTLALKQCLDVLKQCTSSSTLLLQQMQVIAYTLPEYPIVRAMGGVGNRLAPRLIAEIGDTRRFTSGKALNAYAGNDAPPYQSGQFEGTNRHISKRGSAPLRKACYEVMQALKLHKLENDVVYQFMIKKEAEGKPKNVAKMAGVNKFLRIYYARVMEVYN